MFALCVCKTNHFAPHDEICLQRDTQAISLLLPLSLSLTLFLCPSAWQSAYTLIYFCNINDVDAYVNVNGSENSKSNKAEKYTHSHAHTHSHTHEDYTQPTYVWLSSSWCYFFVFFFGRQKRSTWISNQNTGKRRRQTNIERYCWRYRLEFWYSNSNNIELPAWWLYAFIEHTPHRPETETKSPGNT